MTEKEVTKYVVSAATGEVINELCKGDRIIRKASLERMSEQEEMRYSDFAILNITAMRTLSQTFDIYEMGVLGKLMPYVSYISCRIQHRNGKQIGTEGIAEIVGLSRNKTYTVLTSLIVKGVLYREKSGREVGYYLNPYLMYRGKSVGAGVKAKFKPILPALTDEK